jgi:hypothetical protein
MNAVRKIKLAETKAQNAALHQIGSGSLYW